MTTKEQISEWFDRGLKQGYKYMLIVCDTFDHEDYPVFVTTDAGCMEKYKNPGSMQRVMEVYRLSDDKQEQINAHRTIRLPNIGD